MTRLFIAYYTVLLLVSEVGIKVKETMVCLLGRTVSVSVFKKTQLETGL